MIVLKNVNLVKDGGLCSCLGEGGTRMHTQRLSSLIKH